MIEGATAGRGVVYAFSQNQAGVPAAQGDIEEPGIVIASVAPDGPAAQAGVKRSDILVIFVTDAGDLCH